MQSGMINNSNVNSVVSSPVFGRVDVSQESIVKEAKTKCPMSDIPLNKHFKFVATIGKGAYGSVFLVKNTMSEQQSSPPYAIKVLKDPEDDE